MKKYFVLIFTLLLALFVCACKTSENEFKIEIKDVKISDTEKVIEFRLDFSGEETLGEEYKIKQVNYIYKFEKLMKETVIEKGNRVSLDSTDLKTVESKTHKLAFTDAEYKCDLSFLIEIIFENNSKEYSSLELTNVYDLALSDYKTNPISLEIYNYFIVSNISLEIDLESSEVIKDENKYSYVYTKTSSVTSLIITLKKDYNYSNDFKLILNGVEVDRTLYLIKDNVLTYKDSMHKVSSITVKVDLLLEKYSTETDTYTLTYSNPSYDKITVIITLKGDYVFAEDFILNFNDKDIEAKKYKIEGNVLTYIFDDPNWTGIY